MIELPRPRGARLRVCVLTGDPRLPDLTKRDHRYNDEDFATHRAMREAFESLSGCSFAFVDDHEGLLDRLRADRPGLVINFCDTGFRNIAAQELHVPAMLEMFGIPYSGASPACMALCYDKQIVRLVAEALDVPTPAEAYLGAAQPLDTLPDITSALIKPNQGDGSIGIRMDAVVRSRREAEAYVGRVREELPGCALLIQEYLPGPEYGIGLIGNPGTEISALPALEVDFSRLPSGLNPILSFESKTMPDSPYWTEIAYRRASVDETRRADMERHARRLFARLGCRDYARFDFRCAADGTPRLMEVNPNPAWANDAKLALMAGFAGIAYPDMLGMILAAARTRLGL